ncbi:MAG: hypothetical protein EOP88_14615 [Verrucomicrobiaceae bacterium]|nr:MAG: hypothetical protein EOP88_14615 [Verrucomicrobiaceae bacterium]
MKASLLITASVFAAFGVLTLAQEAEKPAAAAEKAAPAGIYGSYELKLPDGGIRKRTISHGRWMITQSFLSGELMFHHGGSYIFDGKNYIEKVEYAAPSTEKLIGNNHKFIITVQDGAIHMKGVENPWDEVWERVDDKSTVPSVDMSVPTVPGK